jgi:hypothetical protein
MSLPEILEYRIHPHSTQLFEKLNRYRELLALYLCPGPTIVGGPLTIKFHRDTKKAFVDWTQTTIERLPAEGHLIKWVIITFLDQNVDDLISHASLLLFDINNRTFEYFDPNGISTWYYPVLEAISSYARIYAKGFHPLVYACPRGPQKVEQGTDTCADWSLLFLYLQCRSSHGNFEQISQEILQMEPEVLQDLIIRWRSYLWDLSFINQFPKISSGLQFLEERLSSPKTVDTEGKIVSKDPIRLFHLKEDVYRLLSQQKPKEAIALIADNLTEEELELWPHIERLRISFRATPLVVPPAY